MPIQVLMPALSPTMTEGKLAKWLKHEGDAVKAGEILAEIETDKATMEVEAVDEGTVGKLLIPEGTEGVAVNTPIALLLGDGEGPDALADTASGAPPPRQPLPRRRRRRRPHPRPPPKLPRRARRPRRPRLPSPNIPARPRPRPCARPCATPWPRRCGATRRSFSWARKSRNIKGLTR